MTYLNRLLLLTASAAFLAAGFAPAQAQTSARIGFTDYELIIVQMPQYREVQTQLQTQAQQDQQELATMEQTIQEKFADYQNQSGVLSAEARQTREEEIVQLQTDLQTEQQNRLQALDRRQNELLQPLFNELQGAIDEVAAARGLTLVLSTRVSTEPVILFADEDNTVDITTEVMSKLGISITQSPTGAGG
ncbi:MAG: OmpH family outer membrane protein [Bacteroidota bacterium]